MDAALIIAGNNCAGEVRLVRTGEDYANWALEILVKFRDAEDLQVLTAQRQSGGVSPVRAAEWTHD